MKQGVAWLAEPIAAIREQSRHTCHSHCETEDR